MERKNFIDSILPPSSGNNCATKISVRRANSCRHSNNKNKDEKTKNFFYFHVVMEEKNFYIKKYFPAFELFVSVNRFCFCFFYYSQGESAKVAARLQGWKRHQLSELEWKYFNTTQWDCLWTLFAPSAKLSRVRRGKVHREKLFP